MNSKMPSWAGVFACLSLLIALSLFQSPSVLGSGEFLRETFSSESESHVEIRFQSESGGVKTIVIDRKSASIVLRTPRSKSTSDLSHVKEIVFQKETDNTGHLQIDIEMVSKTFCSAGSVYFGVINIDSWRKIASKFANLINARVYPKDAGRISPIGDCSTN